MRRGAVVLALVASACGTGAAPAPMNENADAETKTRLRAKVWSVDGVELFRWFYDAARDEDCFFVQGDETHAGPGPTHWCLPRDAVRHDATGGSALFADKGCAVPLALAPLSGAAAYVIARGLDACAEAPRVFRAEAPQQRRPYFFDGASCLRAAGTVATQGLGEEIPLSEFVSGVETVTPLPGPIARLEIAASDGARQTIGGFDPARGIAVKATDPGGAGDPRWLPARFAFENGSVLLYRDAACTTAAPAKIARDALCPLGAAFAFEGECGDGKIYALGAELDPSTLFERSALGACVASKTAGALAYARGEELGRASFAAAKTTELGAGRVRLRGDTDGESAVVWTDLFDTQTGELCAPVVAADGQTRCLPSTNVSASLFADAACEAPAFEEAVPACGAPPARAWVRDEGRVFRVTATAAPLYERSLLRGCRVHASPEGTRGFALEEADVAAFSVVTEVTR